MAARFHPSLAVDSLRYEGHQPPLYYLVASAVDRVMVGRTVSERVTALRLLGVVLGGGIVLIAWLCGLRLFAGRILVVAATALPVALLPQHVAMTAAVNNDVLAWLLSGGVLWAALTLAARPGAIGRPQGAAALGVLMGAVLLTKTTAYVSLALPAAALAAAWLRQGSLGRPALLGAVGASGVALGLGCLWFGRNLVVYGGADVLGLARHHEVVTGQPLAPGWSLEALRSVATTLLQSGWVQLGWMTVPAEAWVYGLLAAVTGLLGAGAVLAVRAGAWRGPVGAAQLSVLAVAVALAAAQVAFYNLQFLQPQGRYLFVALTPAAALAAAGLAHLCGRRALPAGVAALAGLLVWLNGYALLVMAPHLDPG